MPKENIERAIKRASEKDAGDYKEVIYEGFGPHGIAFLVETATDNTTRTVANLRNYFNKKGGSLGNSGSGLNSSSSTAAPRSLPWTRRKSSCRATSLPMATS